MTREIYLDNNATTQVHLQACDAMMEVMRAGFGNPSSAHRSGEKTRRVLFAARNSVSQLFGCLPENILFGSGATELNNWVLTGLCEKPACHFKAAFGRRRHPNSQRCVSSDK